MSGAGAVLGMGCRSPTDPPRWLLSHTLQSVDRQEAEMTWILLFLLYFHVKFKKVRSFIELQLSGATEQTAPFHNLCFSVCIHIVAGD